MDTQAIRHLAKRFVGARICFYHANLVFYEIEKTRSIRGIPFLFVTHLCGWHDWLNLGIDHFFSQRSNPV